MRQRSWRALSRIAIYESIDNTSPHPVENYQQRVKEAINAAYPFGMRKDTPHRVWLEERAAAFYGLGIIKKPPKKRFSKAKSPPRQDLISPGQLNLWQ